MNGRFPRNVVVQIDSRERNPLLFPDMIHWSPVFGWDSVRVHLEQKTVKMDAGDYLLEGWPSAAIIERKASFAELFTNLCTIKDRPRQLKSFDKLDKACKHPYILLEGSPAAMYQKVKGLKVGRGTIKEPGIMIDRLWEIAFSKYKFGIIWSGTGTAPSSRRILGEIVVRVLLRHAFDEWKVTNARV